MHEIKLGIIRQNYFQALDVISDEVARSLIERVPVTERILSTIVGMYSAAKVEQVYHNELFESAYHSPITSELEFFLSRIAYHYSDHKRLRWHVFLRRQFSSTAPDIRIQTEEVTTAIIEVKAKGGWIQPFLSKERYEADKLKLKKGTSESDPDDTVKRVKDQLSKYREHFSLETNSVFFLLPTLKLVHRKKYTSSIAGYHDYFARTSGLPGSNLILLSENPDLDLSNAGSAEMKPTNAFENMIYLIEKRSILTSRLSQRGSATAHNSA